ncbi:MAG: hypothetical protein ACTSVZ_02435 [Promethearchaeota archaeon]
MPTKKKKDDETPRPEDEEVEEKAEESSDADVEEEIDLDSEKAEVKEENQEDLDREIENVLKDEDADKATVDDENADVKDDDVKDDVVKDDDKKGKVANSKETATDDKKRRKRKQPKIDLNKNPKLKRIVQESEHIDDVDVLKDLRDTHNNGTRDLINKIKKVQIEISNVRNQALDYRNKRDDLNKKVQDIKSNKSNLVENLNDSRANLKKAKNTAKQGEEGRTRRNVSTQISKLRKKIDYMEKKIETEDLELREENSIVDQIDKLERSLQELMKENTKPKQFKAEIDNIRSYRKELSDINDGLRSTAEESQNYHLLYLDCSKEIDELRREKRNLQRELNQNRFIADIYHQRLIEVSQKQNRRKRISQKAQYQNKKKIKKEIQRLTLEDAKDKLKKGAKLNIFEARAFLEEKANKK